MDGCSWYVHCDGFLASQTEPLTPGSYRQVLWSSEVSLAGVVLGYVVLTAHKVLGQLPWLRQLVDLLPQKGPIARFHSVGSDNPSSNVHFADYSP